MPNYIVLRLARDHELPPDTNNPPITWIQASAAPLTASSGDAAIEKVRAADPEVKMDREVEFVAVPAGRFNRRRLRRRLVETWELADADAPDDEPTQGTLGDA